MSPDKYYVTGRDENGELGESFDGRRKSNGEMQVLVLLQVQRKYMLRLN